MEPKDNKKKAIVGGKCVNKSLVLCYLILGLEGIVSGDIVKGIGIKEGVGGGLEIGRKRLESVGNTRIWRELGGERGEFRGEEDALEEKVENEGTEENQEDSGTGVEEGRQFFLGQASNRGKRRRRPWEWGNGGGVRNESDGVGAYWRGNVTGSDGGRNKSRLGTGAEKTGSSSLIEEEDKLCPDRNCKGLARAGTNVVQSTLPLFKFLLAAFVHAVGSVIFFYFWKNIYYPVNDPYATVSPYGYSQISQIGGRGRPVKKRRRRIGG